MGYDETTNLKLKKPTVGTSKTDWPGYINGNFDTLDAEVANRHKKTEDITPDVDNTRSLGSAVRRLLNGFFSQITLGGVTRTTWPASGSATQSMDDAYNNGSVVGVDNTDVAFQLASGKKFRIANADASVVMDLSPGQIVFPASQNASTDPNTLDDYEEGTFTPVLRDGVAGNAATTAAATGVYTKVGNLVQFAIVLINITTTGLTASNAVFITGLPFVVRNTTNLYLPCAILASAVTLTTGSAIGLLAPNTTYLGLNEGLTTGSGAGAITVTRITSGSGDFYISGFYYV